MAGNGVLRSASGLVAPAVDQTLSNLEVPPQDAALTKLAEVYAREMDRAVAVAAQADRVLEAVGEAEEYSDLRELVDALRSKLAARTAVENLGPRLLAVLDALGATPKARAAASKGGGNGGGKSSKLAAIREARAG